VQVNPESVAAWTLLAAASFRLGLEEQAVRSCQELLKLDPNSATALHSLGILYSHWEHFEEAARETYNIPSSGESISDLRMRFH
jgi:Flp pilus assembly protein TadD